MVEKFATGVADTGGKWGEDIHGLGTIERKGYAWDNSEKGTEKRVKTEKVPKEK